MSRRRKLPIPVPTPKPSPPKPSPPRVVNLENQMRGLIQAARAPRARRFVTPIQVQSRINETIMRELDHAQSIRFSKSHNGGKRVAVEVHRNIVQQRNALHRSPLLRARLPEQVRNVLLDSERALECTRRETRREVMFALHRTGKGGRKNRKARWTADSRISCKR